MDIPTPSEQDKDYFKRLVPLQPGVEIRPMFGNLAAFMNGHMFMGMFGPSIGVKLDEPERKALLDEEGAGPFGPDGRMAGYVALPQAWRSRPKEAAPWVAKALAAVAGLPPKVKAKS